MIFFIASALLTLSASSHAAPLSGTLHNRSFRMGTGIRDHVGFRSNFARNQNRRFFPRGRRFFFQQLAWPAYWFPYDYPYDYSYLNDGPEDNDQYCGRFARVWSTRILDPLPTVGRWLSSSIKATPCP